MNSSGTQHHVARRRLDGDNTSQQRERMRPAKD